MQINSTAAFVLAIAGGALLWVATSLVSGRAEAWDSELYWSVAYPLCILVAGMLGYLVPEQSWRWGISVMIAQPFLLAFSSSSFGLLPMGLVFFAVMALPPIGMARIAARWRKRK